MKTSQKKTTQTLNFTKMNIIQLKVGRKKIHFFEIFFDFYLILAHILDEEESTNREILDHQIRRSNAIIHGEKDLTHFCQLPRWLQSNFKLLQSQTRQKVIMSIPEVVRYLFASLKINSSMYCTEGVHFAVVLPK